MRVERHSGCRCQALPGVQSRWDGTRCPQGSWSSATVHGELRQGPFPSLLLRATGKGGAGPEKAARSLNELRKAHLLTITAQSSAITSCRERQEVCLGAAACGSPTARVCPSAPRLKEAQEAATGGQRERSASPSPRILDGRGRGGGNSSARGGASPGVPPAPRVRL